MTEGAKILWSFFQRAGGVSPSLYYTSRPNLTNTRYLTWEKAGVPAQIAGKSTKPVNMCGIARR